jgi:hypothetical protein
MLMTDVTHPHRVLTSGPPQLPDDAANAGPDFSAAGAARLTIEHLDTKMCSMILKAITDLMWFFRKKSQCVGAADMAVCRY